MAFIGDVHKGTIYAPGYFLNHEECVRKTREIPQTLAITAEDGTKYVAMGTIFPANDDTAEGIVYEDVDVTVGNMPGSVVLSGVVIKDRLPVEIATAAKTALEGKGFTFVSEEKVTRPDEGTPVNEE